MFEGLFGAEDDDAGQWEASPVLVSRGGGGRAPTAPRARDIPFIGLINQYASAPLPPLSIP